MRSGDPAGATEEHAAVWAACFGREVRRVEGSREERRDVDGRYPGAAT